MGMASLVMKRYLRGALGIAKATVLSILRHRSWRHVIPTVLLCWTVTGTAIRTVDGDTVVARLHIWHGLDATETIRLLGVDTPELTGQTREAGLRARAFTEQWLGTLGVDVRSCARDSFGRLLAVIVRAGDGENLAEALIRAGHGVRRGAGPR